MKREYENYFEVRYRQELVGQRLTFFPPHRLSGLLPFRQDLFEYSIDEYSSMKWRDDAKFFLLRNFHDMVIEPYLTVESDEGRAFEELFQLVEKDLQKIVERANEIASFRKKCISPQLQLQRLWATLLKTLKRRHSKFGVIEYG